MSDRDSVQPYHARDAAPGQETADVVAEVLQHAAARDEAAKQKVVPKGPPRWMLPLTVNVGVMALYFLIAQPSFIEVNPLDDPRPSEQATQSARHAMFFDGIVRINGFAEEQGRLPTSLDEAGSTLAEQGVTYQLLGDSTYMLTLTVGEQIITFDSGVDDPAEFTGAINLPG